MLFTLDSQVAIGLFALIFLGTLLQVSPVVAFAATPAYPLAVAGAIGLVGFGLFMSTLHLGKPIRFYRGFNNLRHSPVAREGAGVACFMGFAGVHMLAELATSPLAVSWLPALSDVSGLLGMVSTVTATLALLGAGVGLYYMDRCYRIKARPFWAHVQTGFAFAGCSTCLGALCLAVVAVPAMLMTGEPVLSLLSLCAAVMASGLALEALGLYLHARDMNGASHEGAVSHYVQQTTFGKTYQLRNLSLGVAALGLAAAPVYLGLGIAGIVVLSIFSLLALALALVSRALFYVLVVPTTMPGAFFWRNKGFEQHARDIGLADMPQVGVAPLRH